MGLFEKIGKSDNRTLNLREADLRRVMGGPIFCAFP